MEAYGRKPNVDPAADTFSVDIDTGRECIVDEYGQYVDEGDAASCGFDTGGIGASNAYQCSNCRAANQTPTAVDACEGSLAVVRAESIKNVESKEKCEYAALAAVGACEGSVAEASSVGSSVDPLPTGPTEESTEVHYGDESGIKSSFSDGLKRDDGSSRWIKASGDCASTSCVSNLVEDALVDVEHAQTPPCTDVDPLTGEELIDEAIVLSLMPAACEGALRVDDDSLEVGPEPPNKDTIFADTAHTDGVVTGRPFTFAPGTARASSVKEDANTFAPDEVTSADVAPVDEPGGKVSELQTADAVEASLKAARPSWASLRDSSESNSDYDGPCDMCQETSCMCPIWFKGDYDESGTDNDGEVESCLAEEERIKEEPDAAGSVYITEKSDHPSAHGAAVSLEAAGTVHDAGSSRAEDDDQVYSSTWRARDHAERAAEAQVAEGAGIEELLLREALRGAAAARVLEEHGHGDIEMAEVLVSVGVSLAPLLARLRPRRAAEVEAACEVVITLTRIAIEGGDAIGDHGECADKLEAFARRFWPDGGSGTLSRICAEAWAQDEAFWEGASEVLREARAYSSRDDWLRTLQHISG